MAGGGRPRWKLPTFHRHSHNRSRSHSGELVPPEEFVCPISGVLMADPVILPTGQTYERSCLKAFVDLGVDPKTQKGSSFPPPTVSTTTSLVPNLALRSAIISWCDSNGIDRPQPIEPDAALRLVCGLLSSSSSSSPSPSPLSSLNKIERLDGKEEEIAEKDEFFDSFVASPPPPPVPQLPRATKSTPSHYSSSSSSSSDEFYMKPATSPSPLEQHILGKLKSPEISDQEEGLSLLRQRTRDSKEERVLLCTQNILASLRPFLLSCVPNAVAAVVNLSLDPANKVPVVRSGAVPPIISALKSSNSETRSHAAAAIFSLAVDESSKAAIGALGALQPLLHLLSKPSENAGTRGDAALSLYHLSTTCSTNRSKLAKMGAAKILLGVVSEYELGKLGVLSLMVVGNLAGCAEGRAALMDAGAVEVVVGLIRKVGHPENSTVMKERREHCMGVLYGLSKGSLRFRGLAKVAGAEEVFMGLIAEDVLEGEKREKNHGESKVREMAERMLKAMRGEGYMGGLGDDIHDFDETRSTVSDPAVAPRRRQYRGSHFTPITGINSSEF